jgi:predicted RNA-binding protein YlxR (DUF448 family)
MTDEKVLCPDDGEVCLMTEEEKKGMGCWLCPKIQNLRDQRSKRLDCIQLVTG